MLSGWLWTAAGAAGVLASPAGAAFTFNDIEQWVGFGSRRAALVIDWNDGLDPQSLAWGFRWEGAATGADMLQAILAADERLVEVIGGGGPGTVFGLGYDLDGDGFGYVPGPGETGHAADPDDHYREGWFTAGYWAYYVSASSPYGGGTWDFSLLPHTQRELADGSWDGWSYAPDFSATLPDEPVAAAVPAPGSLGLLALAVGHRRRRRG